MKGKRNDRQGTRSNPGRARLQADAPTHAPYPRSVGPCPGLGVITMSNETKINTIVPFAIMVIILAVRWYVIKEYSINPVENTGLCVTAVLSLLLSLFNLVKGNKE